VIPITRSPRSGPDSRNVDTRPPRSAARPAHAGGFTILELMIVLAIIGIIAAISLPVYSAYMLKSKTAEAKTNLGSLRVAEESYYTEHDAHHPANAEPPVIPGAQNAVFDFAGSDFAELGWSPEGRVYFSYAVAVSADGSGFTADAGADMDADGFVQLWGYSKPDAGGGQQNGSLGCDVSFLMASVVGRCGLDNLVF